MRFENIKKRIKKSFDNDFSLRIYALILAIIGWFFVSATVYPTTSMHVKDVSITVDLKDTSAEKNGLNVINQDLNSVTVQLEGNRAVIGNIKASDLLAYTTIDNITAPGKYQLPIGIKSKTGKDFTVLAIRPAYVNVTLDRYVSQQFNVEAEAPNVKVEDGFIKETPICSPSIITITGPEEQVKNITRCVVRTDYGLNQKLNESYEVTSGNQLILYNDNTVMNTDDFKIDKTNFSITIPVFMKKTLDFKLNFNKASLPPSFPIDDLKYTLDTPQIEVAAPNDSIANVGEIHLGNVDLRDVDIGTVLEFPVDLPEGYRNLTGVQKVTVTFNTDGFIKKKINIPRSSFSIINGPAQYDIIPVTSGFSGVTFIGPKDVIDKLTIQDVIIQVDLSSVDIQSGEYFNAPVSIFVPNKGTVWALKSYTATFQAKDK